MWQVKVWKSPICWRAHRTSWTWRREAASSGGGTLLTTLRFLQTLHNNIIHSFELYLKRLFLQRNIYVLKIHICAWIGFWAAADSFISPFQHKCTFSQVSLHKQISKRCEDFTTRYNALFSRRCLTKSLHSWSESSENYQINVKVIYF